MKYLLFSYLFIFNWACQLHAEAPIYHAVSQNTNNKFGYQSLEEYINLPLDTTVQVSLLTCNPGNEVYSTFGHSAIFIYDSVKHVNRVYNYGTFAFEDNFIYKFVKGDLNYCLSVGNINGFINEYIYEQRGITQQVLNLSFEEKIKLYEYLQNNYKPENRNYHYDFLFDNCSTRILDAINFATNNQIQYDYSFITKKSSYRQLIASKAAYLQWLTYGMDLMLGIPCDKTASDKDHLFLPDNLMLAYFFATIKHGNTTEPFVVKTNLMLDIPLSQPTLAFYLTPIFIFSCFLILVILLTIYEYKNNKWFRFIDVFIYFILATIGLLFIFMWTSTRHMVAYQNMGLLFANPLLWIFIGVIIFKKIKAINWCSILYLVSLSILIITWHWLFPQKFNIALFPFFITLAIRAGYIYLYSKKKLHGTA